MKNNPVLWLAAFFFIVSMFGYITYSQKGYPYGLGCTVCNKYLPYGLTPKISQDNPFNFVLFDNDDYELVGIGFRYRNSSFTVNDFLAYGYNDSSVIVKAADSIGATHYLLSYKTGYNSKKGNPEISFRDLSQDDYQLIRENYQWIEIEEGNVKDIKRKKAISLIGVLLSTSLIIIRLKKLRNPKGKI